MRRGSRSKCSRSRRGPSSASFPTDDARAVRERAGFDVEAIAEREKVTDHDVAAFVDVVQERVGAPAGAWVHYGLTSSDVVDTALALQMTRALDRILDGGGHARSRDRETGARVPRHADGRAHARHPRRADDVRRQARALGAAGAARPRASHAGPERDRGRQAFGRGRYVLEHRPVRRAVRVRAARARSGAGDAGACPRSPRRGAVRVRVGGRDDRVVRARDPASAAHRGARGRGRVPRGPAKGLERDAAQAQPDQVGAALRTGARAARQSAGRRSRTSRCGTSATSLTRRSSASSSPTR